MPTMDLVVIARNSADSLRRIYGDRRYLESLRSLFNELVYVDSSSEDDSAAVMGEAGFTCLSLESGGRLSAAAARQSAADYSSADLLFFLDGDMVLEDASRLPSVLDAFRAAQARDARLCGFTGFTLDFYPGGGRRLRTLRPEADGCAPSFGGFVALEREALLAAGNWNGNVVANEELELHARLRQAGRRVLYLPEMGVHHHTVVASPLHELAAAYLPLRPARYGALGMAVRASWRAGALSWMMRLMPEPFVFLAIMVVGLPMVLQAGLPGMLALSLTLLVTGGWVARRRGPKFIAVVPALALSMGWGLLRYRELPTRWHVSSARPAPVSGSV